MSSTKKLLTVFGATGTQGGSVITTVLSHPELSNQYRIRAVTRDVNKASSQALLAKDPSSIELVSADMNSLASLTSALKDSHAVFAVTNYWETLSKETEIQQGKNIADAVKAVGTVEHFIFSSLPPVKKLSDGKWSNVDHFDGKYDVEEYVKSLGLPASFFMAGMYMDNIENSVQPVSEDGKQFVLSFPFPESTKAPFLDAARDTGKFVAAMLLNRERVLGKDVYGATAFYSMSETVHAVQQKKNAKSPGSGAEYKVTYHESSEEEVKKVYGGFGMPAQVVQDVFEMFKWIEEGGYYGKEHLVTGKSTKEILKWGVGLVEGVGLKVTTLEEFVEGSARL